MLGVITTIFAKLSALFFFNACINFVCHHCMRKKFYPSKFRHSEVRAQSFTEVKKKAIFYVFYLNKS